MDMAFMLARRVSLITPARYLFNAGKTPKEWNEKILRDKHFKVVRYEADSTKVFSSVDIKGGVAVMYRDSREDFGAIVHYTAFPELNSMCRKVAAHPGFEAMSEHIYPQNKFDLEALYARHPGLRSKIGSNGNERRLTTSIFSLTEVFRMEPGGDAGVKVLGLVKNNREYRWVDGGLLEAHPCLGRFKVLVPKSNGSGAIGETLSTPLIGEPLIGEPLIGVTQSFIQIGTFDTRGEAAAALRYVKTKTARCLLGVLKVTQDNSRETWAFVPWQDFSANSDIDWSAPIADIDRQLYEKYGFSDAEVAFVETKVRAME